MSDQKKDKETFDQAIAKDWVACIERDISAMSPGQFELTKKVIADFESKRVDTTQKDFQKKLNSMTDSEFNRWKMENLKQG